MKPSGSGRPKRIAESINVVYCSRCHVLALAVLDSQPLCCDCLLKLVTNKDLCWISSHLRPIASPISGPIAARDRGELRGELLADGKKTSVA